MFISFLLKVVFWYIFKTLINLNHGYCQGKKNLIYKVREFKHKESTAALYESTLEVKLYLSIC